jgi:hypothetical protein
MLTKNTINFAWPLWKVVVTAEWCNLKWYCNSFHCLPTILNIIKISCMFWKIKYGDGQTFLRTTCPLFFVPSLKHIKTYNLWCSFYSIQYQSGQVFDTVIIIYISPDCWQYHLPAYWNAIVISTQQIKGRAISYINNYNSSCIPTLTHQIPNSKIHSNTVQSLAVVQVVGPIMQHLSIQNIGVN